MAEVVDAKDLKSFECNARAGSSPALGTIKIKKEKLDKNHFPTIVQNNTIFCWLEKIRKKI